MDFAVARATMVDTQIRPHDVTGPGLVSAFLRTPREDFVPAERRAVAYSDMEIATSPGRALWTPRDTAKLMKLAAFAATDRVLVIAAGAGYEAAVIAQVAGAVTALEDAPEPAAALRGRLAATGAGQVVVAEGPLAAGWPAAAPYDAVYVCGMVGTVSDAWTGQLAQDGRLVAVIAGPGRLGRGTVFTRSGMTVSGRESFDACPPRLPGFEVKAGFVF